jgi:peptide/nickel transport system ATP-binding protein
MCKAKILVQIKVSMVVLIVDGLSASYFTSKGLVHAVEDVSFNLDVGESIGIAGESGCGKSTLGLSLLRMIANGKITGDILLDGNSILSISDLNFDKNYRWKHISMVFQGAMNSLDPVFTIKEQFTEILKQNNFSGDFDDIIKKSIISVSLDVDVLKKYPHELSGGMKQRIIIALALLLKPKFVVADEPTTALDVLTQAQIVNLFKNLKKEGMSFMLITHDLAVLSEVVDKIGIMYGGHMVEFGSSSEIYKNPKHPYTQGLLESIPKLTGNDPKYIKGTPPRLLDPIDQCRFLDRCPFVIEKCKTVPPKIKTATGYVRCWLYEDKI